MYQGGKIRASDIVKDIRSGMRDQDLMDKYSLSARGLESVFKQIIAADAMTPYEIYGREQSSDHSARLESLRRESRLPIYGSLHITDAENSRIQGVMTNISEQGFGVRGIEATRGQHRRFTIAADELFFPDPLELRAICRWAKKKDSSGMWEAGFEIIDVSAGDLKKIVALIQSAPAEEDRTPDEASKYDFEDLTETVNLASLFTEDASKSRSLLLRGVKHTWFGQLLQALPVYALVIDVRHKITFVNRALKNVSPDCDDLFGGSFTEMFPEPSRAQEARTIVERAFSSRKHERWEAALAVGDQQIWGRLHFKAIRLGQERSLLILIEDLTSEKERLREKDRQTEMLLAQIEKRRKAEDALKDSERRYSAFLDSTTDLAFMKDKTFRYVMVNKANQEFLGRPAIEIIGKTDFELMPSVAAEKCRQSDIEALGCDGIVVTEEASGGRVFETRKFAVKLENGQTGIGGLVREVTERKKSQEALRESEERYRQITENSLTGIFIHQDGVAVYVNQRLEDMLGYTKEEMTGRQFMEAVHPADREAVEARVRARLDGEPSLVAQELRLLKKTGEEIWCDIFAARIDYRGRPAIMGNLADITDRKKAEKALRESEKRFKDLAELLPEAVVQFDPTGTVTFANLRAFVMFGYSLEDLNRGINVIQVLAQEDREKGLANIARILTKEEYGGEEYSCVKKDSTKFPAFIHSAATVSNEIVVGATSVIVDLSARRRTEAALRESEERFKQVAENAGEWIWEVDANGVYRYSNSAVEEILGYSPNELIGKKYFYDLFAPEVREDFKEATLEAFKKREAFRAFVNPNVHKNGNVVIMETSGSPVIDEQGALVGYRGTDTDITERKRVEEELCTTVERFYSILSNQYAGLLLVAEEGGIEFANQAFCDQFELEVPPSELHGLTFHDIILQIQHVYAEPGQAVNRINEIVQQQQPVKGEEIGIRGGKTYLRDFIPVRINGKLYGRLWHHKDITDLKRAETEKARLIVELTEALGQVKKLSGLLPICASCKKIRDDKGYWTQIESYIRAHSEAEFSHSICPECAQKLYPGVFKDEPKE